MQTVPCLERTGHRDGRAPDEHSSNRLRAGGQPVRQKQARARVLPHDRPCIREGRAGWSGWVAELFEGEDEVGVPFEIWIGRAVPRAPQPLEQPVAMEHKGTTLEVVR